MCCRQVCCVWLGRLGRLCVGDCSSLQGPVPIRGYSFGEDYENESSGSSELRIRPLFATQIKMILLSGYYTVLCS